jgi:hypothetical protein
MDNYTKTKILVSLQDTLEMMCQAILEFHPDSLDNQYGCHPAYVDNEVLFIIRSTPTNDGMLRELLVNGFGTRAEGSHDVLVLDIASLCDAPERSSLLTQLIAWGWTIPKGK